MGSAEAPNSKPGDRQDSAPVISQAVIDLYQSNHLRHFGDAAVQLVDDYLTQGNDDCLFMEPEFLKMQDLNAFLKSERLGKSDEYSPRLRTQIAMARKKLLQECANRADQDRHRYRGRVTPNPSRKLTRYGRHCKPGLRHSVYSLSPGLQCLPPRAA